MYQNICKQLPTDSISIPKHHFADQSLLTAFKANCCCFGQHRFVHWVCKGQVLQTAHEVRAGKTLTCSAWIYLDTLHPLLHFVLRIWPLHYSYYTAHNNRYLFDVHTLVSFMLFARNYRCHKQLLFFYAIPRSSELAPFRHLVVYDAHRSRFFLTQSHRQKTVASMSKGEDHRAIVSWNIAKSHGSLHFGRPSSSSILFDEISHFCRECSFNVPSTSPAHSALFCRPLRDSQRIPHEEAQKMRRCCSAAQQIFKTSWTVQLLPIKENWTFD